MDAIQVCRKAHQIAKLADKFQDHIANGDSKNAEYQLGAIERQIADIRKDMGPIGR